MSWIVQNLLRDRTKIKTSPDIDSDIYNDLLILESKIKDLSNSGLVDEYDLELVDFVSDGKPFSENTIEHLGRVRQSVSKDFKELCRKIAFYVGGEFTDEGYLAKMKRKYKLSDKQIELARDYMKGKYRFRISRKQDK